MNRSARMLLLSVVIASIAPSAAWGVTLGTAVGGEPALDGPAIVVEPADGAVPYGIPSGGGVITSWSVLTYNTVPATYSLKVFRPIGAGGFTVISTSTADAPVSLATGTIRTFPARVPVQAGDVLGLVVPDAGHVAFVPSTGTAWLTNSMELNPPDGSIYTASESAAGHVAMSATLEPDADHDGYGDQTQDSCPLDPEVHSGPCAADLALSQSFLAAAAPVGTVGVLTGKVRNLGTTPAEGASLVEKIGPGLSIVNALLPGATCELAATVQCPIGEVPAGATRSFELVIEVTAPGPHSVTGGILSMLDPNPGNDGADAQIAGTSAVSGGAPTPAPLCTVPRLRGQLVDRARLALRRAGCRLGRVSSQSRRRRSHQRIVTQDIPAGVRVRSGTSIAVATR